jgi:16S rRNA (cytosine1402-N4)-methyltransferase
MIHKPVLLGEAIENLNLKPGMTVIDGTLGAGGHALAILEKILPGGKLIAIDWDKKAIEEFQKRKGVQKLVLKRELILINNSYANIAEIVRGLGPDVASGAGAIFVDLGFSSDQVEDAKRGFSFLKDGPLDMRYSSEMQFRTAADIVNGYSEKELADVFWKYGEEKFARKIASGIVAERKKRKISKTSDLVDIISRAVPERYRRGRIHFATRIFQALRIETNRELENLESFLEQALEILANEGRLAAISFHSLEDRIVKQFFQKEAKGCVCPPKFPNCVCGREARLKIVTKKPIVPQEEEIKNNPRARSAKLRVAERI